MQYIQNEHPSLSGLLNGKSVIIVGRANYLATAPEYENQGEFIDSHDIIVRINQPYPHGVKVKPPFHPEHFIHPDLQEHLGTKTHIYYICHDQFEDFVGWGLETFPKCGGILFCSGDSERYPFLPKDAHKNFVEYIPTIKKHMFYHTPSYAFQRQMRKHYNSMGDGLPSTGLLAMAEILNYDIKSLHIIGFTSYLLEGEEYLFNAGNYKAGMNDLAWYNYILENDNRVTTGKVLTEVIEKYKKDNCQ